VNRLPRTESLLVLACAAAAAMLAASQFITLFELTPPGGEALRSVEAADQHGYATLVLAAFALVMLVVGIAARSEQLSQVAAFAVAACGVVALLIFLVGDLPDANKIGTLDGADEAFIDAKAEPQAGFWLELVGALVLTVCGAALATLKPEARGLSRERPREPSWARTQDDRRSERAHHARERDDHPRTPPSAGSQRPPS
jgi:hypothetical protein